MPEIYLDETAVEVANLFKPEDQKEVVDVFNNYAEKIRRV